MDCELCGELLTEWEAESTGLCGDCSGQSEQATSKCLICNIRNIGPGTDALGQSQLSHACLACQEKYSLDFPCILCKQVDAVKTAVCDECTAAVNRCLKYGYKPEEIALGKAEVIRAIERVKFYNGCA